MKKPIIKNWTKYWTTTLAVSGMLVMGACGDSNERAANEIETAETEVEAPVREEVADLETDADDRQTAESENDVDYVAEDEENIETERTSARSTENSATLNNMDQHVEEHEEVNTQIRETLTDENNQLDQGSTPDAYDEQGQPLRNTDQTEAVETESKNQGTPNNSSSVQQENNSVNQQENASNPSNTQQGTPANQGNLDNQQDTGVRSSQTGSNNEQTGTVEFDTNRQGATEMEVESDPQGTSEMGNNQDSPTGTNVDTQNQGTTDEMGVESDRQGTTEMQNTQSGTNQDPQIQRNQTEMNSSQGTQGTMDQTQPNNSLNNEQDQDTTNVYDRQSNTNMNEGPDAFLIILEQSRADYSPESQQQMDEIMNEYNTRRESMRGQTNEETGAYVSPEVDPQPKQGVGQLMEQIHENLTYPQNAAAAQIEGTVFVNFVVDENGNITEANAIEDVVVPTASMEYATSPLNPTKFSEQEIEEAKMEMKKEAIKAVKETSGQWEPAQQDGQVVKSEVQLPVVFDIERIGATEDVPLQE